MIEVEDVGKLIARIRGLAHQQLELDEREHDVADVGSAAYAPVLEDHAGEHAEALEREVATGEREFATGDVAPLRETLLALLQRAEHEEIGALVEPLLAQADAVHDSIAKSQLGHC